MNIWSRFSSYWETKGWLVLFVAAIVVIGLCWLVSGRNNDFGTYDKYQIIDKSLIHYK